MCCLPWAQQFYLEINHSQVLPTQKPVALFEWLVKTYSNAGDTVLDFCAGSGTTAVACENTNRNWICIEKEKEYYDVALSRIESTTAWRSE